MDKILEEGIEEMKKRIAENNHKDRTIFGPHQMELGDIVDEMIKIAVHSPSNYHKDSRYQDLKQGLNFLGQHYHERTVMNGY